MPSIAVRTTWPALQVDGRVHGVADAARRAGEDEVARPERDDSLRYDDDRRRPEDELRRAAVLAHARRRPRR